MKATRDWRNAGLSRFLCDFTLLTFNWSTTLVLLFELAKCVWMNQFITEVCRVLHTDWCQATGVMPSSGLRMPMPTGWAFMRALHQHLSKGVPITWYRWYILTVVHDKSHVWREQTWLTLSYAIVCDFPKSVSRRRPPCFPVSCPYSWLYSCLAGWSSSKKVSEETLPEDANKTR